MDFILGNGMKKRQKVPKIKSWKEMFGEKV